MTSKHAAAAALAVLCLACIVKTMKFRFSGTRLESSRKLLGETAGSDTKETTSACLLTKDDLALVPEWIAYHYHVMDLRFLMIAVDPTSATNITVILERFRTELPDLEIRELSDVDFMPMWFVEQQTTPEDPEHKYHHLYNKKVGNSTEQKARATLLRRHRYRQIVLQHYCTVQVKKRLDRGGNNNWLLHTDTDEFLVPNPMWRSHGLAPEAATEGSVLSYANEIQKNPPLDKFPKPFSVCMILMMTSFGAMTSNLLSIDESKNVSKFDSPHWVDTPGVPSPLNASRFETVHYRYHDSLVKRFGWSQQKAMLHVGSLPKDDMTLVGPHSFYAHRPSPTCEFNKTRLANNDLHGHPLSLNHYKGTLERYLFREDIRRNEKTYEQQAMSRKNIQMDDGWITTWAHHFVEIHGIGKVRRLLGDHFINEKPNMWTTEKARVQQNA